MVPRAYREKPVMFYPFRLLHLLSFLFLAGSVTFFVFGILGLYQSHWYSKEVRWITPFLPFPVAFVDERVVWYNEAADYAAVFAAYESEEEAMIDPFSSGVDRAIDLVVLRSLADALSVSVSTADVRAYASTDDDQEAFMEATAWSHRDYDRYVIEPLLLAQKIEPAAYASRDFQQNVYGEMESLLERIDLGITFSDLAEQYSDDSSSAYGGMLGFLEEDSFEEGMESLFDLPVGEVSEILEGDTYYLIAKALDETVVDGERVAVSLQIITKNKNPFANVFETYKEARTIRRFIE